MEDVLLPLALAAAATCLWYGGASAVLALARMWRLRLHRALSGSAART